MPHRHPASLQSLPGWRLTCVAAAALSAVLVSPTGLAQTAKQASSILQKTDLTELQRLQQAFQAKHEADEAAVKAYLEANPGVSRTQMIDGKVHTIVRIGADGQPEYRVHRDAGIKGSVVLRKNTESASLIKADSLYPGGSLGVNITGQGMVAGVWEPGLPRVEHELFVVSGVRKAVIQDGQGVATDDLTADNIGNRNHATHVTGTMVGKDSGFPGTDPMGTGAATARGIAYSATAKNWTAANDLSEMTAVTLSNPLLVSNHSYGDANTQTTNLWKYGAYDAEAKDWDRLLKAAPMYLPFIAGGNEQQRSGNGRSAGVDGNGDRVPASGKGGYDIMTGTAAAKNTMTVGAVNADQSMSDYSNWGPTDDGRVKPEIVARGTGINSAQAFDATPARSTTAYSGSGVDSSGTSYAAPAAAAAALLLQQYYASINNGQFMLASTLKSLIMGTATDLGRPGPDYQFGYGLMNTEAAARAIKLNSTTVTNTNCSPSVATGTNCSLTAPNSKGALVYEWKANPAADNSSEMAFSFPAKGGTPLVVNLGWTDDEGPEQVADDGIDNTTSRMVYDFDMKLRTPAGAFIRPWVLPGIGNPSGETTVATGAFQANGGPFRQVVIPTPVAGGTYILYVTKKADSPATTRTLSLVVTGLAETAPVNGACGAANGVATAAAPIANLCSTGNASAVTNGSPWTWTCAGANNGTTAMCSAPNAAAGTGTGRVSVAPNIGEGPSWVVSSASFSTDLPAAPPAGVTFPNGILSLNLTSGAAGSLAQVTINYSNPIPAGAVYWKYGKEPNNTNNHWYVYPNAVISGNTVTLTLTDGAQGDNDLTANSQILDPGGPGLAVVGQTAIIPTLSEYALMALAGLMLLMGMGRKSRMSNRPR